MPYKKGESGNLKGRPKKATETEYLAAITSVVKRDDWRDIVERAMKDAKRGDTAARKWLSDYIIGVPVQRQEISGPEGGPIPVKGYVTVSPDDWDATNTSNSNL